jgi:glutaredoxin
MAQRRLFSPAIVESDAFLEMPVSTQALYFHLGMNADDDGFVCPKMIMRMVGASEDDLKVLLAKRFVLSFETGVIVIKHWLIHNSIRKDRYIPTKYLDEKNMLVIKDNNSYTELRQPNGNHWLHQGKLIQGKLSKDIYTSKVDKISFDEFWKLYPNKVEKKKSEEKWNRLSIEIQRIILLDIPKRKSGEKWSKDNGKYIEMPTTYINGERWNDEIKIIEQKSNFIDLNKKQNA